MMRFDRIILIVLALGVWALVLKPTVLTAHLGNAHDCFTDTAGSSASLASPIVEVHGGEGEIPNAKVNLKLKILVSCYHD